MPEDKPPGEFRLGVLTTWIALCALACGCSSLNPSLGGPPAIDIVILTVLDPEYEAALSRVEAARPVEDPKGGHYRWVRGEMQSRVYDGRYQVVVGVTGDKGEVAGALAARAIIARWNPRHMLLVGIAGGIEGAASVGDVVLADTIWAYELGHLADEFIPETETRYTPDPALLKAAVAVGPDWRRAVRAEAPDEEPDSRVRVGLVGSGDKVIESKSSSIYGDIIAAEPDLIAVEMEGAGAAAAVLEATNSGREIGFLMVRAVSDQIRERPGGEVQEEGYVDPERERWRDYAADVAAAFMADLVQNHWPVPPR